MKFYQIIKMYKYYIYVNFHVYHMNSFICFIEENVNFEEKMFKFPKIHNLLKKRYIKWIFDTQYSKNIILRLLK